MAKALALIYEVITHMISLRILFYAIGFVDKLTMPRA